MTTKYTGRIDMPTTHTPPHDFKLVLPSGDERKVENRLRKGTYQFSGLYDANQKKVYFCDVLYEKLTGEYFTLVYRPTGNVLHRLNRPSVTNTIESIAGMVVVGNSSTKYLDLHKAAMGFLTSEERAGLRRPVYFLDKARPLELFLQVKTDVSTWTGRERVYSVAHDNPGVKNIHETKDLRYLTDEQAEEEARLRHIKWNPDFAKAWAATCQD